MWPGQCGQYNNLQFANITICYNCYERTERHYEKFLLDYNLRKSRKSLFYLGLLMLLYLSTWVEDFFP